MFGNSLYTWRCVYGVDSNLILSLSTGAPYTGIYPWARRGRSETKVVDCVGRISQAIVSVIGVQNIVPKFKSLYKNVHVILPVGRMYGVLCVSMGMFEVSESATRAKTSPTREHHWSFSLILYSARYQQVG